MVDNVSVRCDAYGVTYDPANSYIYATNFMSGTVSIIESAHVPTLMTSGNYRNYYIAGYIVATVVIVV